MKLKQLAVIAGVALVSCLSINNKALAQTVINPQIDSYVPQPSDIVLGTCSQIGLCFPGQEITASTSLFPFISTNDSNFNVTSLFLTIDPNEDAIWENAASNIYNNIQISPDGKRITFTDGTIPVGENLFSDAQTTPTGTEVQFSIAFDGTAISSTSIPEPASILGMLVFGTLGVGSSVKRYLKYKAQ